MIARAEIIVGHVLDVLERQLAGHRFHCCLTSPPYWGLRDYKLPDQDWNGWRGSLGLEPTIDLYLEHLVGVFDAVKRVLRDDGTLWVNLGDSYAASGMGGNPAESVHRKQATNAGSLIPGRAPTDGLKPLDCCNIPFRFALKMQECGWYHRSTIVWAKGISFCPTYSGSVMPESINGWRWEQCRVKVEGRPAPKEGTYGAEFGHGLSRQAGYRDEGGLTAEWEDCPGCDKCNPHGGHVLRRGSWRPTSAYEFVFLFAKTSNYYADAEAVREQSIGQDGAAADFRRLTKDHVIPNQSVAQHRLERDPTEDSGTRNLRNVWAINPQPFPDAHFATFPESLVEPIIKVSTSEKGVCPECGSPWARVTQTEHVKSPVHGEGSQIGMDGSPHGMTGMPRVARQDTTLGWRPTCGCLVLRDSENSAGPPIPATVLDPFAGSGTSLLVARKLGRHSVGIELSGQYAEMARRRLREYAPLFQPD